MCLVLLATTCVFWASSRSNQRVQAVTTIPLQAADGTRSATIDVSKQGTLLVFPWKIWWLLVWDYQRQQAAFEFPQEDDWVRWEKKASLRGDWQFRFQGDGSRIIAIQTPWLVLIDAMKQTEIARALPSESYLRKDSPGRPSPDGDVRVCHLDVDAQNGFVAAAYNVGKDTNLYVYDSDLKRKIASWELPRIVQCLCWSPDGKKLAVLFNGWFNEDRQRYYGPSWTTPNDPDVWIIDARSGKPLVKFWTGTAQDQIAFSKDGNLVYVTNESGYFSPPEHLGAIRAFSAVSGALVRTISAGPKGVHSAFSLSPDGSLIAADASTYLSQGFLKELNTSEKISRLVLLDTKTGHLLFEHHERTEGDVADPLGLAFSPDGQLLFVDFPGSQRQPYQRIEVYSIDDRNRTKH
jgi:sugar lactone lactonase YvrE